MKVKKWTGVYLSIVAPAFLLLCSPVFSMKTYIVDQQHPDANDEGPGTAGKPFKTISRAVRTVAAGDTVLIRTGIYRETPVLTQSGVPGKPIVIMAEPGANAVIRGSDVFTSWMQEAPGVFSSPWLHESLVTESHEMQFGFSAHGEQVFVNDQLLKHVRTREELEENAFYVDRDNSKLVIRLPLQTKADNAIIEVSIRANWFDITGDYIVVSGLKMEQALAIVQKGGFLICGSNWLVENNEFSYCGGGRGASFSGSDGIVRDNDFHHNGQMGFCIYSGKRILFQRNKIHHNNTNVYPNWEEGSGKVSNSVECIFRRNAFFDEPYGPGLWLDIDNYRNIVEQNTFDDIGFAAIMIEISYDNLIRNNIIRNTRYYSQSGSGVLVQLSCNTRIYNNLVIGSEQCGIHLRWHIRERDQHCYEPSDPQEFFEVNGFRQSDWMGPCDQYPENDNDIRNNIIINHQNAAVAIIPTLHPVYFKNNQSDYNYFGHTGNWHPMEGSHRLIEWQAYTGFDLHSITHSTRPGSLLLEDLFVNPAANDFRLKAGSPLIGKGTPLKEVTDDFLGHPRLVDGPMDIGPYVFDGERR